MKPEEQITIKFLGFQELMAMQGFPEFSDLASLCIHDESSGSMQFTTNNAFSLCAYKKNEKCSL